MRHLNGSKVLFTQGEYDGMTGVVLRVIPMRYRAEIVTYQVQIDGYPKPGGWNGKVYATDSILKKVK